MHNLMRHNCAAIYRRGSEGGTQSTGGNIRQSDYASLMDRRTTAGVGVVSEKCVSWCRSQVQTTFELGHCILLDYSTYQDYDLCYVRLQ